MANEINEQQRNQLEREAQFIKQNERYLDETANLRQNADYLLAMPPRDAVDRLQDLEDAVLIAHLRMAEQITSEANGMSMVPVWLAMLPADQAARIIKKMQLPSN
jgi:flagellar protein FlbB